MAFKKFLFAFYLILIANPALAKDSVQSDVDREIRIQIVAQQEARMLSPMRGLIENVPFKDGQLVQKNDLIVKFDCGILKAQLDQTNARVKKQEKLLKSAKRLQKLGSESAVKVAVYQAELDEALGAKKLANKQVSHCSIKAPFSGRLANLSVKSYHNVQEGEPLFRLINNEELEAEMIVPSKWMRWLQKGHVFEIVIDETDQRYKAEVLRYGGQVDPVSQSVKVYSLIQGDTSGLLSGMSGRALFDKQTINLEKGKSLE